MALTLLSVALVSGCGGSDDGRSATSVVAAFYPIAYAAQQVAPGAEVLDLTPAGAEPHDLELSPRDVQKLTDADVVLYFGAGFMPAVADAVEGHENAVDLLSGELLEHADGSAAEGSTLDPHVWLDPRRFAEIARRIAGSLGAAADADDLVDRLDELDAEFRTGLADCERREIVTSHAAFGYLAEAYDLQQVPLTGVSPEIEPSARAIERLVDEVKAEGATTVFFETLASPKLAETVAREAGAQTAVLDPLEGLTHEGFEDGDDYFSVMRENLAALRAALDCA